MGLLQADLCPVCDYNALGREALIERDWSLEDYLAHEITMIAFAGSDAPRCTECGVTFHPM